MVDTNVVVTEIPVGEDDTGISEVVVEMEKSEVVTGVAVGVCVVVDTASGIDVDDGKIVDDVSTDGEGVEFCVDSEVDVIDSVVPTDVADGEVVEEASIVCEGVEDCVVSGVDVGD